MAEVLLKSSSASGATISLYANYSTSAVDNNNNCTVTCNYRVNSGGWNIGAWSDVAGSNINGLWLNGAMPYFNGNWSSPSVSWGASAGATYSAGWKWGVNSSWGGFSNNSGTFNFSTPSKRTCQPQNYGVDSVSRTSARLYSGTTDTGICETVALSIDGTIGWRYYSTTSASDTFAGLAPNTAYRARFSTHARNGDWGTETTRDFVTSGNAPTISLSSLASVTTSSATMRYSATYDTNAEYSTHKWDYGTTTSYGNTVTKSNLITGLTADTTYYYRLTVTDNKGRSSTATGSFQTYPTTVQISNASVEDITPTSALLTMRYSNSQNVSRAYFWIYEADGDTEVTHYFDDAPMGDTQSYTFESLNPGTDYVAKFQIKTIKSNEWSTIAAVSFKTLDEAFVKIVNSDGVIVKKNLYGFGFANVFDKTPLTSGGFNYELGKSMSDAINNFTPESGYGYIKTVNPLSVLPNTTYTITAPFDDYQFDVLEYANLYGANKITSSGTKTFTTGKKTTLVLIAFKKAGTISIGDVDRTQLYKANKQKQIMKTDVVKVSGLIRYIDIGQSGSTVNETGHVVELEAFDKTGTNVALGKTSTMIEGDTATYLEKATDGVKESNNYVGMIGKSSILRVDLGAEYQLDSVKLWRYFADERTYLKTFCYGRKESENLLALDKDSNTQSGVTTTNNGDGTITLNGTTTVLTDVWLTKNDSNAFSNNNQFLNRAGDSYNVYYEVLSGTTTMANPAIEISCKSETQEFIWNGTHVTQQASVVQPMYPNATFGALRVGSVPLGATFNNWRIRVIITRGIQKKDWSQPGAELCYKFHDYKNSGLYTETAEGKTMDVKYEPIDVMKPVISSIVVAPVINNITGTKMTVTATREIVIDVINNLLSIRADAVLAANQGRVISVNIGDVASLRTSNKNNLVAAINELLVALTTTNYSNTLDTLIESSFIV